MIYYRPRLADGADVDVAIAIVTGTVIAATPLLFAAMGELVVERSAC